MIQKDKLTQDPILGQSQVMSSGCHKRWISCGPSASRGIRLCPAFTPAGPALQVNPCLPDQPAQVLKTDLTIHDLCRTICKGLLPWVSA